MSLKVRDIKDIVEKYAPLNLMESYDNVGLMVGNLNQNVNSILVALDCTMDVIDEAINKNCNLIVTHHPLLFKKPSTITSETLIGRKIIKLIKNDISLYSAHTNLDSTEGGINDTVMQLLGFQNYITMDLSKKRDTDDNKSGIGRFAILDHSITLDDMCDKIKKALNISYLRYAGNDKMAISKVAVINGSGQDYFSLAKEMGADCIITGDTSYHYVSDFSEEGIAIIDAGHFGTEWMAFKTLAKVLQNNINSIGFNCSVLLSESVKDPYKYK